MLTTNAVKPCLRQVQLVYSVVMAKTLRFEEHTPTVLEWKLTILSDLLRFLSFALAC